jgi:nanoRNase/pAp phosphatase (c-di-AMP/oligoRNAs hydrolase)
MWLCLNLSFISLVADRGNPDSILVRAGVAGHIEGVLREADAFIDAAADFWDKVICSLRNLLPFDASVITTHFDGGGHALASGFTLTVDRFFSEDWRR